MVAGIGTIIGALGAAPQILEAVTGILDRFVPDPKAKAQAAAELQKLVSDREVAAIQAGAEIAKAQTNVNLAEAQGNDRFSARWRPSVGWICAAGFGYQFVLAPVLTWTTNLIGVAIGAAIPPAPTLSINDLMVVLTGILGLGVQRTVERVQGVSTAVPGTGK